MSKNELSKFIQIGKSEIGAEEVTSVNSRDIYEYLKLSDGKHNRLFQTCVDKYGFVENQDYISTDIEVRGVMIPNYIVTLDVAKELCMVSNTERGKETRKYFIAVEKEARKPITVEALIQANLKMITDLQTKVVRLENKTEADKPKVALANAITGTTSNIDFETFAKALYDQEGIKMGRNKLMAWCRDNKYLTPKNKPYQAMLDRGLMSLKEGSYVNASTGELVTYTQPRITGKGQLYFTNKILDELESK